MSIPLSSPDVYSLSNPFGPETNLIKRIFFNYLTSTRPTLGHSVRDSLACFNNFDTKVTKSLAKTLGFPNTTERLVGLALEAFRF